MVRFLDSVADRVSDAFFFGGVSWYLAAHHRRSAVLLPFAILAVTSLISYQRAKAELLGYRAKGGLMERAERFILLGLCFIAGTVSPAAFVPSLWVFFGLITATPSVVSSRVWQEAEGPVRLPVTGAPRRIPAPGGTARRRAARVEFPLAHMAREHEQQRDATGVQLRPSPSAAEQPLESLDGPGVTSVLCAAARAASGGPVGRRRP